MPTNLRTWWPSLSRAARFDVYTRGSFYLNLAALPILAAGAVGTELGTGGVWIAALAVVQAALCIALVHTGLNYRLGKGARPVRLIGATAVVSVVGAVAGILAYPHPTPDNPDGPANLILLILALSFVAALATTVSRAVVLCVAAAAVAAAYGLSVAQGSDNPLGPAFGLATLLLFVVLACRGSVWMLDIVWELDRARLVQAELAVADERLRFARDLHDVMGRTLAAVAVKSELAAQLAKRGRPTAADEMLEVRRMAQDALTDMRAVVGGYRGADLHVELAGARSLLDSAGIACRVIGDGGELPGDVQSALAWVVREGATNVLRHSEARGCDITLDRTATRRVTLTMENDAVAGPDADGPVRLGNGLVGLAERIAGLGGRLSAGRHAPDRFRLTVSLPLGDAVPEPGRD